MLSLNLGSAFNTALAGLETGVSESHGIIQIPLYAPGSLQVMQDESNLVRLAVITSPLDKPASIKIANTRIANVYQSLSKGMIPLTAQALNTSGQTIFVELQVVASKTLASGAEVLSPATCRIELKLPNTSDLDDQFVRELLSATISAIQTDSGDDEIPLRVTEVMRGVMFRD